jgi:GAF domain
VDHTTVRNPLLVDRGIKSLPGVPLLAGGKVIGVLHVGSLSGRPFGQQDARLLQPAADRAALALHSIMSQDDALAAVALQRSLLPTALPAVPGLDLAARCVTGSGTWAGCAARAPRPPDPPRHRQTRRDPGRAGRRPHRPRRHDRADGRKHPRPRRHSRPRTQPASRHLSAVSVSGTAWGLPGPQH